MKNALLGIPFALAMVLIVFAPGTLSLFAIWNCLPVIVGYLVLLAGLRMRGLLLPVSIVFSLFAVALPVLFHLAWLFDWGRTATGSSTAGLAFIFVPIWTGVLAVLAAGITTIVVALFQRRNTSNAK